MLEEREIPGKGKVNDIDKIVSERLKSRRMMMGLSQHDLGKAVNVSIQQVQKYEKATNRISSGKLFTLAKFLKVPLDYFYEPIELGTANLAEDGENYDAYTANRVEQKELSSLLKSFSEIESPQSRKKIIELIKTLKS